MNHSKTFGNSVRVTISVLGIPIVALMITVVGCSANSHDPIANSSSSIAASTTAPPRASTSRQENVADTITIGKSGVRCLVGNMTLACVTMTDSGMMVDGNHAFSFVRKERPQDGVEPGFMPGQHVADIAVGDLVLIDTGNCQPGNASGPKTTAICDRLVVTSAVTDDNSKNIVIGIISGVSANDLTIRATDTEFYIPIPPPAQAGRAVYRPNPGQQLNAGQSITVRDYWSLKLNGPTLTISSPTGSNDITVGTG